MACDEIFVPKTLRIKNRRLGLCFRFLQLSVLGLIFALAFTLEPWFSKAEPLPGTFTMWAERGTSQDDVKHCTDPGAYEYAWSSAWVYKPTGCKELPLSRMVTKADNFNMYVATYESTGVIWTGTGTQCSSTAAAKCRNSGGDYTATGGECKCYQEENYFVKNADNTMLNIVHGYSVQANDYIGKPHTLTGSADTIFQNSQGKECVIGGKKKWSTEGGGAISAPISDFLACAGFSLDAEEDKLRSGNPEETNAPTSRITGAVVSIKLHYENSAVHKSQGDSPRCKAIVEVEPQWNSRASFDSMQAPSPSADYTLAYTYYNYGVSVQVSTAGTMAFFDLRTLLQGLTQFVVLWSLPGAIISFISLQSVGLLSNIYRSSAEEKLCVGSIIAGVASRLIAYSASFHSITRQSEGAGGSPSGLDLGALKLAFQNIFSGKHLSEEGLDVLSSFMLLEANKGEPGRDINLTDFVAVCGRNEPLPLDTLAALLSADRRIYLHERVFSDLPQTNYGQLMRQIHAEKISVQSERLQISDEARVQDQGHQSSMRAQQVHPTTHASESLGASAYPMDLEASEQSEHFSRISAAHVSAEMELHRQIRMKRRISAAQAEPEELSFRISAARAELEGSKESKLPHEEKLEKRTSVAQAETLGSNASVPAVGRSLGSSQSSAWQKQQQEHAAREVSAIQQQTQISAMRAAYVSAAPQGSPEWMPSEEERWEPLADGYSEGEQYNVLLGTSSEQDTVFLASGSEQKQDDVSLYSKNISV